MKKYSFGHSYDVGQVAATGMMVATQKWPNEWSWRLPLLIQVEAYLLSFYKPCSYVHFKVVPASINVCLVLLCPESFVELIIRRSCDLCVLTFA